MNTHTPPCATARPVRVLRGGAGGLQRPSADRRGGSGSARRRNLHPTARQGGRCPELTDMARDIAQIIEDDEKSDSVAFVIDDRADVVWAGPPQGHQGGRCAHRPDRHGAARSPRPARRRGHRGPVAETESLVRLINELPDGCIDYIHVLSASSTAKPENHPSSNDGCRKTLDTARSTPSALPANSGGRGRRRDRSRYGHARRYQGCWLVRGLRHRGCREPGRGRAHHGRRLEPSQRQEARLRSARRNPHPRY